MISASHPRRPRLLILAYACSPLRGSESGVGWNRAVAASKDFDTWVICEENEFRGEVEPYLATNGPIPGLRFVYVPMPRWQWRLGQLANVLWYIVLKIWHRRAFRVAKQLHGQIDFNLVHQLTFCGYREPGYLWKMDAPFVWGPVGGTQNYPWRFLRMAGLSGATFEIARAAVNRFQLRFGCRVRKAAEKASAVVAATRHIRDDLAKYLYVSADVISDVGVSHVEPLPRTNMHAERPLRILWSGILQPRKALPLLIEAVAKLPPRVACEVRVLGRGPRERAWRKLAERRGVDADFQWLGWLPHAEALQQYAWADVFVFTSLRDTTGTVLPEALAAGLPVICLDHQGGRDVITEECGMKIPATAPRETIDQLREAIVQLAENPELRERLSRGALRRAADFLWSRQGDMMAEVYRQVLENNTHEMSFYDGEPSLGSLEGRSPHWSELWAASNSSKSQRSKS
jgi:glycosyltransferase involved in cell wall biosynthesis